MKVYDLINILMQHNAGDDVSVDVLVTNDEGVESTISANIIEGYDSDMFEEGLTLFAKEM